MARMSTLTINSKTQSEPSDRAALKSAKTLGDSFEDVFGRTKATRKARLLSTEGRYEKEVLRISEYPEFKKTTVKKCKKVLGKKVCINWPQLWKRTGRTSFFLVVTYPKGFEKDIRQCAEAALTAAVLAALATGDVSAAIAVFEAAMTACLTKKGSEAVGKFKVKFDKRVTHSKWKKV